MSSSLNINQGALALSTGLSRLQSLSEVAYSRISSGKRIDRPAADPAGVAQAAKLEAQQSQLGALEVGLQNGLSRMQVTSQQLTGIGRLVTRLSELATLANNPTQSASDKAAYNAEFTQIQAQLRQTIGGTVAEIGGNDVDAPLGAFNGNALFGPGGGETLSVGLHPDDRMTLPGFNLRTGPIAELIKQDGAGNFTFTIGGAGAVAGLTTALDQISDTQALVGSVQSRLSFSSGVVITARTNQEAAIYSRLDMGPDSLRVETRAASLEGILQAGGSYAPRATAYGEWI
jgi:flagellin